MKKLLFVSRTLADGGAERVVSILCSSLIKIGCQVDLLLYERKENEYPIDPEVRISVLPSKRDSETWMHYQIFRLGFIRNIIKYLNPDYILPFLSEDHVYVASLGLKNIFVYPVRNNPAMDEKLFRKTVFRKIISHGANLIFLQTEEQLNFFSKSLQKKCFILPNPVSKEVLSVNYEVRDKLRCIVSVGRLENQKNFIMLIEAFALIHKEHPEVRLDIYGEGSLHKQLSQRIHSLGLDDNVELCGRSNDIIKKLCEHQLFVMSSNYEGMPNSLMEAMGAGIPCISTDCPTGPRKLIGSKNERGILTKVDDPAALADAIEYAYNHPEEMRTKAKLAKEYVIREFSPESIARQLLNKLDRYSTR